MDKKAGKQEQIKALTESSLSLQKVLTDLAISMNRLSKEISEMVGLFREASKAFVTRKEGFAEAKEGISGTRSEMPEAGIGTTESKTETDELKRRIDLLTEQNKTIAKGLLLFENYLKEKANAEAEKRRLRPLPEYRP